MTKKKDSAEKAIRAIRRASRRRYSAQEKIRIVLEDLRGESSVAELCRKQGINQNLYYRWPKVKDLCRRHGFPEASFYAWRSKCGGLDVSDAKRLKALESENAKLKKPLAESMLENEVTKEALRKKW